MTDEQEYVLGDDVTRFARSKGQSGSAVLSVRLSAEELAAIETVAEQTGKNLSQVVREAVRTYLHVSRASQPDVAISLTGGNTMASPRPTVTSTADLVTQTSDRLVEV
jgi:metal-responsive CopG/Arc/MetJ family transcriptional regulator